jgi:L-lactate utilization protein LutB
LLEYLYIISKQVKMDSKNNWASLATDELISKTVENMKKRGFNVEVVENRQEALEKLKAMLPTGAEVATGSSTTLNEIGFIDYLSSPEAKVDYVSPRIYAEPDPIKRTELRKQALTADNFFASVNAISENGELVAVDQTGSRVGAMPFAAQKLILVAGTQKITPNLESAMQRIREYVFPLEDARAQKAYGSGSSFGKWVILEKEINPERIHVLLVKEALGY